MHDFKYFFMFYISLKLFNLNKGGIKWDIKIAKSTGILFKQMNEHRVNTYDDLVLMFPNFAERYTKQFKTWLT